MSELKNHTDILILAQRIKRVLGIHYNPKAVERIADEVARFIKEHKWLLTVEVGTMNQVENHFEHPEGNLPRGWKYVGGLAIFTDGDWTVCLVVYNPLRVSAFVSHRGVYDCDKQITSGGRSRFSDAENLLKERQSYHALNHLDVLHDGQGTLVLRHPATMRVIVLQDIGETFANRYALLYWGGSRHFVQRDDAVKCMRDILIEDARQNGPKSVTAASVRT